MTFAYARITLAALAVATIAISAPAEARRSANFVDAAAIPAYPTSNWVRTTSGRPRVRHHRVASHRRHHEARQASHAPRRSPVRYSRSFHRHYGGEGVIGGRPSGCPHAYCGCEASRYLFGRIIAELNRAAAWFQFPRAAPAPGMAAVRRHHVFIILSVNGDGTVMAHDGNSGHGLTREHNVSLRGYTVVNPHGARYASR
jgi:hypothetical protein